MARPRQYAITDQALLEALLANNSNVTRTAAQLGMPRSTIWHRLKQAGLQAELEQARMQGKQLLGNPIPTVAAKEKMNVVEKGPVTEIDYLGEQITSPEDLLLKSGIDMRLYVIERVIVNNWEQSGTKPDKSALYKTGLRQIKVTLRRKSNEHQTLADLLEQIAAKSPVRRKINHPRGQKITRFSRALEISIMDPHLGMQCYRGESDHAWDMDTCDRLCMWSVETLLERAKAYGHFDEIVFPFGNDFMHHDNLAHTTTRGTFQPEGLMYTQVYERAIQLAVTMIDRLAEVAPVRVIQVSGNHDQVSSFTLGHVLHAYYRRDANITVDVGAAPYKFYRFGTNLIGYDHGHHISPIRLAAIMAHECRQHWAETTFREWHLGDQHRKGSSKPTTMEEQGVSVEYLPALTPPNAWHKLKGFNWQQRGAVAFVYDHAEGPIARIQVNLDSYTGKPTGHA